MVGDDDEPSPENISNSEDVLPIPETLNFGFQGIDPLRHSGRSPVGKAQFKMVSSIRVQHMSCFGIFYWLYFMKYTNDSVIPDTNKHLKSPVVLG